MGWTPRQVRDSSLWEINAAKVGYLLANGAKPRTQAPSVEAFERADWGF